MNIKNILLVDDDKIMLELLRHILEECCTERIVAFSSSIEALGFIYRAKPSDIELMICDWRMPGCDGIALLKQLRVTGPDIPFLMVTANAAREAVLFAKRAGATDFIAKPFRQADLTCKVQRLLHGDDQQRASPS